MKYEFEYEDEIKGCGDCPLRNYSDDYCLLTLSDIDRATAEYNFKLPDCPLKKLDDD